jgi:hypothetical protein
MTRLLRITLLGLLLIAGLLTALIYSLTWRPEPKQTLPRQLRGPSCADPVARAGAQSDDVERAIPGRQELRVLV